jgi:hypothetical protein
LNAGWKPAATNSILRSVKYIDALNKEGQARGVGVVEVAKRPLLIGTFVFEQTAPALATRGHPRLTKAGNGSHVI